MKITENTVTYIARLAKLDFSDEEKEKLAGELTQILHYMEKLNELDTEAVEPLSHPIEIGHVMRDDEVQPSLPVKEALRNAPAREGNFFKVPKVIK